MIYLHIFSLREFVLFCIISLGNELTFSSYHHAERRGCYGEQCWSHLCYLDANVHDDGNSVL
jgi:hypothetical protein